eukprot:15145597-Alexandrium_andersonii.AAC.1
MSASLVGSEMCIRDSPPCVLAVLSFPPRSGYLASREVGRRCGMRAAGVGCLLYTSDAADDM